MIGFLGDIVVGLLLLFCIVVLVNIIVQLLHRLGKLGKR